MLAVPRRLIQLFLPILTFGRAMRKRRFTREQIIALLQENAYGMLKSNGSSTS